MYLLKPFSFIFLFLAAILVGIQIAVSGFSVMLILFEMMYCAIVSAAITFVCWWIVNKPGKKKTKNREKI